MTKLSPSSRNVRLAPPGSSTGSVPFQLISSRLPRWFFSGPEMVPDPRRSPTFMAQPLEAWCMSCCTDDQYMYLKFVRLMPHQSVAHVRSSIVLDRLKESSRLPLKDLKAG